jgi:hypothetical protein
VLPPANGLHPGEFDIMRKTNRTKKSNRKATARKTTRKAGTSKAITAIAKQFISGLKSGKGFTTVINGIAKKTKKNYNAVCQTLCKSGLCYCTKINGVKVYWPNFTSKATKNTTNITQAAWCQAMVEWCLATGCCTPRQLLNNSTNQKSFVTFCTNCCTKAITGKTAGANTATTGAWMTNWSKSNNRTWKSGKTFKFPTYASRSTGKRARKAA